MESVGQSLKAAREAKRMSVEDVAEATQIQAPTLLAIESNDFDQIPAPLYARGFIKLYAKCVGVDPDPLVSAYNSRSSPRFQSRQQRRPTTPQFTHQRRVSEAGDQETKETKRPFRLPSLPKMSKLTAASRAAVRRLWRAIAGIRMRDLSEIRLPRIDIGKTGSVASAGAQYIKRKISLMPLPRFRLSPETRRIIPIVALALALLVFTIWIWSWHYAGNRPRIWDSSLVQDPPKPYLK